MDAVNFAKDYIRMCRTINYCTQCPLNDTGFCRSALEPLSQKNAEEIVRRVEEWAAAPQSSFHNATCPSLFN